MAGMKPALLHALFNDILHLENDKVETLAEFDGDYYAGKPALTRNHYGSGEAYYFGARFSRDVADALIRRLGLKPATTGWSELPSEVEVAIREKHDRRFAFLLNYSDKPVKAHLLQELKTCWKANDLPQGI